MENTNTIELYTLAEAKEILQEQERIKEKKKRKLLFYFLKQKAFGLFLIALGIVIPFILEGDATASVIAILLGIAATTTKDKVVD